MFSDRPGTPGRSAQAPRTIRSMRTPSFEASYSARITDSSVREFILAMMRAGLPSRAIAASWRIAFMTSFCSENGASQMLDSWVGRSCWSGG
jgi:hypothetical protein